MKTIFYAASLLVAAVAASPTFAGVGCDLNIRVNNQTPNAITVYGVSQSSASKAGLNVWSRLTGMEDAGT